jgi:hypothetical protein
MILTFLTTIGGLIIPTLNLYEVCVASAAEVRTTFIVFVAMSIVHVYKVEFNRGIVGALVF